MDKSTKKRKNIIIILAFLSGLSVLIYEIVWQRYLSLIFGSSVYAVSTVLACFMIGFTLGSWYIGKRVDRAVKSLKIIVSLEVAIGIFGLLSPLIYSYLSDINILIFQSFDINQSLKHLIRFGLSSVVIILPAMLMGGTLPPLIKAYSDHIRTIGSDTGRVYAVNTFGAVIGAFLTGFFFIPLLGLKATVYVASFIDLFVALIGFIIYKNIRSGKQIVQEPKKTRQPKKDLTKVYTKQVLIVVLISYSISGFVSLSFQVYWTKILTLFFRDSVYDFSIVLSAFLVGIAIGSYLCGKIVDKIKHRLMLFSSIQVLNGLVTLLCLFMIHQLPYLTNYLQSMNVIYEKFGDSYWVMATIIKYGYAFIVMLLPTILFGASFPLASHILVKDRLHIGRRIGALQALNTLGATLGSLLSGFIFISLLGLYKSMILTSLLIIGSGILLLLYTPYQTKKLKTYAVSAILLFTILIIWVVPTWDKLRMSSSFLEPDQEIEEALELHYYYEDAHGITSVVEFTPWNQKYLVSNRIYTQNTSDLMGFEDHRRLGHIPLLLHENPKNALVIGLGAGMTLDGVNQHHLKQIDVVEISEGVKNAATYFSEENNDVLKSEVINFIIDDGRNYLATTQMTYDVIIADIIFPMSSGSSNMFSYEYYELAEKRLADNGVMVQWLPIHQMSMEEIQVVAHTFQKVFPNTSLWYGMIGYSVPVIGLVGTEQVLSTHIATIDEKYRDLTLVGSLEEVELDNRHFLLENLVMEGEALNAFIAGQSINLDDHPVLEFMNPKSYRDLGVENIEKFKRLETDQYLEYIQVE